MAFKDKIKSIREVEAGINQNLFWICGGVTILIMIMASVEFFSRGAFVLADMTLLYIGILLIYSLHKELIRWLGKRKVERQGEYFVYGWIGLTTLLYIINFLSKNYFSYTPAGQPLETLRNLSILSLEVLGIFIITRCLKILKVFFEGKNNLEKRSGENK